MTIWILKKEPLKYEKQRSEVHELACTDFARIRVGIGKKEEQDGIDFVIGPLSEEEYTSLKPGIEKAAEAVEAILELGIDHAMNQYN